MNKTQRKKLEQWSPTLLYVSGGIFLIILLQNFVDFRLPFMVLLGPVSSILAIIGVLGVYPNLSEQVPRLSKIGATCLAFAVIVISARFILNQLIKLNPDQSMLSRYLVSSISYVHLSLVNAGYLLFAIAIFRSEHYSRFLGYLLTVPVILTSVEIMIMMFQIQGNTVGWLFRAMVLIQALDYLAMGYVISKNHYVSYPQIKAFWSRVTDLFKPVP